MCLSVCLVVTWCPLAVSQTQHTSLISLKPSPDRPVTPEELSRKIHVLVNGAPVVDVRVTKAEEPLHLVILFDSSNSGRSDPGNKAQPAALRQLLERVLRPGEDCASFLTFDNTVDERLKCRDDAAAFETALKNVSFGGGTVLHDALFAVNAFQKEEPRKRRVVIVVTDGHDTSSVHSAEDATVELLRSGWPVYFVALSQNMSAMDRRKLQAIAAASGGRVFETSSKGDIQNAYIRIAEHLHEQFAVTFPLSLTLSPNLKVPLKIVIDGQGILAPAEILVPVTAK